MNIVTETCRTHRGRYGRMSQPGNDPHSYRALTLNGYRARRCPRNESWLAWIVRYDQENPSLEVRTYRELVRIRELLETQVTSHD